ncbi:ABC transporter ATP-binding protein [Ferrimonas balearica]|uniref:ABC transporter ATP-binding protein n=1 Tax=Ferrimonas balearica TaxID=44012 RepID=UPI001C94B753|nr:ABC transporter ATP-binding protein [Ferrimonas balearica]MBY6226166.1 ABC transporter ATP-binding protein [Ferrimonas balearica]
MNILLQATGLTRHYGSVRAVDGIDITLLEGQCTGLLGPNGAGKTTTLGLLEGLELPDCGYVEYRGQSLTSPSTLQSYRQKVGIQFQQTALPDHLTARECLALFASFYPNPATPQSLIKLCQLEEFADRSHFLLSGGQRQRLILALSLIGQPELLFLDEPTTGLDPQARAEMWRLLTQIKHEGKTLLLSSHYMEEVARLCDHIVVLSQGKVIAAGAPHALLNQHFQRTVIELSGQPDGLDSIDGVGVTRLGHCTLLDTDHPEPVLAQLTRHSPLLSGMTVRQPNLDDLYLKLTGTSLAS